MGIIAVEEFRNGRDGMDYLCFSRCFCEVFFFFFLNFTFTFAFPNLYLTRVAVHKPPSEHF